MEPARHGHRLGRARKPLPSSANAMPPPGGDGTGGAEARRVLLAMPGRGACGDTPACGVSVSVAAAAPGAPDPFFLRSSVPEWLHVKLLCGVRRRKKERPSPVYGDRRQGQGVRHGLYSHRSSSFLLPSIELRPMIRGGPVLRDQRPCRVDCAVGRPAAPCALPRWPPVARTPTPTHAAVRCGRHSHAGDDARSRAPRRQAVASSSCALDPVGRRRPAAGRTSPHAALIFIL
jgi:hypothetical protein